MKKVYHKKKLEELTIKDNFMFGAVMDDEENCKRLLELILGISIEKVTVCKEKSLIYHPEYKGVRLDVIANDEKRTHYNVEMQAQTEDELGCRSRYYHSQIDMELLLSGCGYDELPNAYVIFICDYDPFGKKKYCYTFKNCCEEDITTELGDGSWSIFLSTKGENDSEVSENLIRFLKYVSADLNSSQDDYNDEFVSKLQEDVRRVKASREVGERYMLWELLLWRERKEGREEGREEAREEILESIKQTLRKILKEKDMLTEQVEEMFVSQNDVAILQEWIVIAVKANSAKQFLEQIEQ